MNTKQEFPTSTDVLIVGAGPTGMTLATSLKQLGVDCVVIEQLPDAPDDTPPGVVFLQIDGLGFDTVRRAVRDGDMPTLSRWLAEGSHRLTDWHCDWSSQTGASVCGILHGNNEDILGFRWYEKDSDHVMGCSHPIDAAEIERRHSDGRGLLAVDGASRGN